jgi:Chalcone isomerase-like
LGFQVSATGPEHEISLIGDFRSLAEAEAFAFDAMDVEKFLALVPAMHDGDNYSLLSKQQTAAVMVSGQQIGTITSPQFAEVMSATFLGLKPASPRLEQELLSGHGSVPPWTLPVGERGLRLSTIFSGVCHSEAGTSSWAIVPRMLKTVQEA